METPGDRRTDNGSDWWSGLLIWNALPCLIQLFTVNKNSPRASALPEEDDDFINSPVPTSSQSCLEIVVRDVLLILCIKALNTRTRNANEYLMAAELIGLFLFWLPFSSFTWNVTEKIVSWPFSRSFFLLACSYIREVEMSQERKRTEQTAQSDI